MKSQNSRVKSRNKKFKIRNLDKVLRSKILIGDLRIKSVEKKPKDK